MVHKYHFSVEMLPNQNHRIKRGSRLPLGLRRDSATLKFKKISGSVLKLMDLLPPRTTHIIQGSSRRKAIIFGFYLVDTFALLNLHG